MKKIAKCLMCLLCVLSLLCACAEGTVDTDSLPSDEMQTSSLAASEHDSDEQSVMHASSEESNEQSLEESLEDESDEPSAPKEKKDLFDGATVREIETDGGIFRVEQIKSHFNGDDLVLLYIKNLTDKDYSVTIDGSYLDKDGNVISETESEGFADWQPWDPVMGSRGVAMDHKISSKLTIDCDSKGCKIAFFLRNSAGSYAMLANDITVINGYHILTEI